MNNLFKKISSTVALSALLVSVMPAAVSAATIVNGDLVKKTGDSAVYLIQEGKSRVVPHSAVYHSWGFPSNFSTVKTVTAAEFAAFPSSDPLPFRDGYMFRGAASNIAGFATEAVFFVSEGKIRPVESANTYMKLVNNGVYDSKAWNHVTWVPSDLLSKFVYPAGSVITETSVDNGQLPNGMVVKGATDGLYYVVSNGTLRNITAAAFTANKFSTANTFTVAQSKLNALTAGAPVTSVETSLNTAKFFVNEETNVALATKLVVFANPTSLVADGAAQVTVTATVATATGSTVTSAVTPVTFAITSGAGTLSATTVTPVNGVATVKLTPSAVAGTITVSATATGLTAGTATVTTTVNSQAPQVSSVSNSGMRLMNVVFDRTVDKTSAETTSNYTIKNDKSSTVSATNAKLLADNKTVQLFLADGMYNNATEDSIEVKNVQDANQMYTMTTVTKTLTATDATVPSVVAVEALGSKAIRVTFSEAVDNGVFGGATVVSGVTTAGTISSFRLDDKELVVGAASGTTQIGNVTVTYPDANDYTKALISFTNPIAVGAHTLTVSYSGSIKDYNTTSSAAGAVNAYTMQPAGYVATVSVDTTVPVLSSVEILSQTKVRYTFSKPVNTPATGAFFWSTSADQTSGTASTSVSKVSDSVYEATWGSAITAGTVYFYAGNTTYKVTDYSGNAISPLPSSKSVSMTADVAPAISSVSMDTDSDRIVVVYFNKDVEEASSETSSNYVFKKADGTVLTSTTGGNGIGSNGNPSGTITWDGSNVNGNKKKVTLDLGTADANALPGGTYTLVVSNVKAFGGTTSMTSQSYTFTVSDKTRPTLNTTVASFDANNMAAASHRLVIKFSEALDVSSATALLNYKYSTNNSTWTKLSDLSGVSITMRNSNKDVVITFPDTTTLTNLTPTYYFMVGYIEGSTVYAPKDVSGNFFKGDANGTSVSVNGAITAVSTTGLTSATLKVMSPTLLKATFAREIEAVTASEFKVTNSVNSDLTPVSAEICTVKSTNCDEENAKVVIFTIPSGSTNEFTANDVLVNLSTRGTSALSSKDTLNLPVVFNTSLATSNTNDIKPVLKSFAVTASNTLVLTFDGKIKAGEGANVIKDLIVSQTVGTTTTTLTGSQLACTVSVDSTVVTVTTTAAQLSLIDPVTVRTVSADSISTLGANGAKIAANTTGMQNASFVASAITEAIVAGGTSTGYGSAIATADAITVTFSKNVDRSSIAGTWTTSNNVDYTMTGVSVTLNGSTNKMTVSGIGDFEFSDLYITDGSGTGSVSGTASLSLNINTNQLIVALTSTPTQAYYVAGASDTITYTPATGIKTTVGTMISSDYKPVATTN